MKVNYNGKTIDAEAGVVPISNRAFRMADGVFESIRVIDGRPCFLDNHLNRLKMGLKALKINTQEDFSLERIEKEINELLETNSIDAGGRVRLTVSRAAGGTYRPLEPKGVDYLIEATSLESNEFFLNEKGLIIDIYPDLRKQVNSFAYYKTLGCQLYIMASVYAMENGLDNVLITNETDCVIESADSNLFIVSNGVLYTPPLADGCLGGTMRMEVINTALRHEIKVYETTLRPQNLLVADEIFLTNAIQGIRWVSGYRQKRYFHNLSERLLNYLNEEVSP